MPPPGPKRLRVWKSSDALLHALSSLPQLNGSRAATAMAWRSAGAAVVQQHMSVQPPMWRLRGLMAEKSVARFGQKCVLPSDSRGFILPPHTRSSDGGGSSSMVGPPHGGGALSTSVVVNPEMTMVDVACPRATYGTVVCLRAAQQRQQHSQKQA